MTKREKLEERVRSFVNDISMAEFERFLITNGFERRGKKSGSHRVYQTVVHNERRSVTIVCPHGNRKGVCEYDMRKVLAIIDEKKEEG